MKKYQCDCGCDTFVKTERKIRTSQCRINEDGSGKILTDYGVSVSSPTYTCETCGKTYNSISEIPKTEVYRKKDGAFASVEDDTLYCVVLVWGEGTRIELQPGPLRKKELPSHLKAITTMILCSECGAADEEAERAWKEFIQTHDNFKEDKFEIYCDPFSDNYYIYNHSKEAGNGKITVNICKVPYQNEDGGPLYHEVDKDDEYFIIEYDNLYDIYDDIEVTGPWNKEEAAERFKEAVLYQLKHYSHNDISYEEAEQIYQKASSEEKAAYEEYGCYDNTLLVENMAAYFNVGSHKGYCTVQVCKAPVADDGEEW